MRGEADFEAFVRVHGDALLRSACLLAADREAGRDLLQLALVKVARHWARAEQAPVAYARRVLVTTAVDVSRRRRWREVPAGHLPEQAGEDAYGAVDDRDVVLRALRTLSVRQRAVLVLRYAEDRSEQDVAAELGITVGTVKSTASRALSVLRERLPLEEER